MWTWDTGWARDPSDSGRVRVLENVRITGMTRRPRVRRGAALQCWQGPWNRPANAFPLRSLFDELPLNNP